MDGTVTSKITMSDTQVVPLASDGVLGNTNFVFSDGSSMLTTSDANLDDGATAYVTVPLHLLQDGSAIEAGSDLPNIILKNLASQTFLLDTSQLTLLPGNSSHQVVLGSDEYNNEEQEVTLSIQNAESERTAKKTQNGATVPSMGLDIAAIDLPGLDGGGDVLVDEIVAGDIDAQKQRVTFNLVSSISSPAREDTQSSKKIPSPPSKPTKRGPGRPRREDTEVEPPIGKGPFKCDICSKEFTKWLHCKRHIKCHSEDKPFLCTQCSASFNVESNLILHKSTHNVDDPVCPECHKKFSRIASLKAHIMLHEKEENLFCSECGDEFSTMSQLEEHKKEHEDEWVKPAPPQCRQCKYQFSRASQLREHMKEHYKVKASLSHKSHKRNIDRSSFIHKCDICHKCFQKPSQLVRHKRIHTGERPFKCHLCSRAFNQKGSLQIHMSKHNGIKPFRCEFCAASFSQKGNLRAHIVRVHTIPLSGEQVYKCMECPCVFKKLGSLNAHMSRMHCGENSQKTIAADDDHSQTVNVRAVLSQLAELEADLEGGKEKKRAPEHQNDADILQQALVNSGLSGKDPTNLSGISSELDVLVKKELKENEATESNAQSNQQKDNSVTSFITLADRSFDGTVRRYIIRQRRVGTIRWHQCSYCSKEFKKASDLVRHIRIHTRERPFKCTHCFRSFAVKSTLTAHIRTHTGVRDHVCYICMKKFSSASSLKVHIRMHTGSKPFSCQYCDKAFRTTGHMKAHMLSHTKDSSTEDRAARRKQAKQKSDISNLPDVPLQEPILITNNGLVQTVPRSTSVFLPGDSVSADRPYKCTVCNAAFRKSSHLKQHIRMHTGERPYKCNLCERRFISNGVLKAHMRTHEGVKSYKCPECNNLFSTNGSLKRHMGTHSDVRPFMCPYCHKTFKTSVNCRKHMKTHKHELALQVALQAAKESGSITTPVVTENATIPTEGLGPDFTHAFADQPFQVPTTSEHQDQEESAFAQSTLVHTLATSDLGEGVNTASNPGVITHTLHADASGTITLPALSGQHTLTQENIREIERTLNEQIFGASANSGTDFVDVAVAPDELGASTGVEVGAEGSETESTTTEDLARTLGAQSSPPSQQEQVSKENMPPDTSTANSVFSTSFETTPFESCVFSTITLQADSLELDALGPGATITTNMASILPPPDAPAEEAAPITESEQPDANTDAAVVEGPVAAAAVAVDTEEADKTYVPGRPFNTEAPPEERPYKCKLCSRAFKKLYHLKEHARGHIGKTLGCTLCEKKCTTYTALRAHMKTHSGTKDYACDTCGCRFTTNGSLKRHMSVHSEERPLKCCICNAMFRTDHLLRRHIKLHEPRERKGKLVATNPLPARGRRRAVFIQLTPEETKVLAQQPLDNAATVSEKVLIASAAEKDRISELKDPEAQYQMEPLHPNQCKYCPKSFRKPSDLVRHIRIHTGERPYQCSCCNKCFTVKSTLDSHVKTHGGQKLFACHVCGCLFSTKGSLKVHMRLHTGAKPFKCPLCELRFRTSGHRKAHLMSHMKQAAAGENRAAHLARSSRRNKRMQMVVAAEANATQEQQEQQQQQDQQTENNNGVPEQLISHITIDQATFNSLIQPTSVAEGEAFSAALLTTAGTTNGTVTTSSADGQIVGNFQLQLGDSLQIAGVDSSGTLQLATAQTLQLDDALLQQFQASNIIIQAATSDDPLQQEQEQVITNEPHPSGGEMTAVHFEIHTDEQGQIIGMTPLPEDDPTQTEEITFDLTGGLDMEVTESDPPQRMPSRFRVTDSRKGGPTLVAVESVQPRKQNRHDDVDDFLVTHDCTTCGKRFSKPSQLERHNRIHTGERPYACPVCSKTFNQNNTLNTHVKSHTGERPYPCPHCSYSSTQKGNLKTHMRRAHQFSSLELGTSSNTSTARSILKRKQQQQAILVSTPDASGKSLDLEKVVGDLFPQMRNTAAADP